jgi:hypothetical protein
MTTIKPSQSTASYDSTKLGIDAHAQNYWVSRQVDGAKLLFTPRHEFFSLDGGALICG